MNGYTERWGNIFKGYNAEGTIWMSDDSIEMLHFFEGLLKSSRANAYRFIHLPTKKSGVVSLTEHGKDCEIASIIIAWFMCNKAKRIHIQRYDNYNRIPGMTSEELHIWAGDYRFEFIND